MKQPVVIDRNTFRALYRKSSLTLEQRNEIEDALSNQFTPVSERLPEEGQTCEAILVNGSRIAECVYRGGIASGFYFLGSYLSVDDWSGRYAVTHWRATEVV